MIQGSNPQAPERLPPSDTGSLFDLPRSGGGRRAKIALVVTLDLILAGAGVAMIWSYFSSRSEAAAKVEAPSASAASTKTPVDGGPGRTLDQPPEPTKNSTSSSSSSSSSSSNNESPKPPNKTPSSGSGSGSSAGSGSGSSAGSGSGSSAGSGSGSSAGSGSGSSAGSGSGSSAGSGSEELDAGAPNPAPLDAGTAEPVEDQAQVFTSRIEATVRRNSGALSRCYSQAAKVASPDDPLAGIVEVRFVIMPTEEVGGVKVRKNTTGSDVLGNCLVGHVKSWRFPNGPSEPLDFIWPFRFRASN